MMSFPTLQRISVPTVATMLLFALLVACASPQLERSESPANAQTASPIGARAVAKTLQPPIAAKHPFAIRSPQGTRNDDYYWLRDDTRKSVAVLDYLRAENAYRDAMLAHTAPLQEKLYAELTGRLQPDESSVPMFDHGWWYYARFVPGADYAIYARRPNTAQNTPAATEQVMLDEPAMAQGHEYFAIGATLPSPDGHWLAYCEDTIGRRQYTLKVKSLDTGAVQPFAAENVEPNIVWTNDNKTVLYVAKDSITLQPTRVMKHVLGTDAQVDALIYEERDPSYSIQLHRSASDAMLLIELASTQQSEWRYMRANDAALALKTVLLREPNHLYAVDHLDSDFIIRSNWQAPNFRIMRAPVGTSADKKTWRDVVPPRRDVLIEDFALFHGYLALNERADGLLKLRVHPWATGTSLDADVVLKGEEPAYTMNLIPTPGLAGAGGAQKLRYVYTSLKTPETTYDYDLERGVRTELKRRKVLDGFDAANYATQFVRAAARDGASIPVSVVYRKSTKLDGTAPLYQYGYGSYGISNDPEFRDDWVSLLDRGFVIALAHVRGGQELGRGWFEDGRLQHKRNTFTDFVDVTAFLLREKYGAKDKVFAEGRSAGGLLMGAVANIAPQDYRGIIAGVPFVDVVTTMLDESIPLTTGEFDQWGNPKEKEAYDYMLSYSPYDNVTAQRYPAMFVSTGLWDSQVQYFEPAKWVAKLRAMKTDANPLLFSIDMTAGHGGKSGRLQRSRDTAREYAFVLDLVGISQ